VFKRGKRIGREISAGSKFSSVSDKNRGGGAAMMPRLVTVIPAKTCGAKTTMGEKTHRVRSRPMRRGVEFGLG
jgi:hypothetical protein